MHFSEPALGSPVERSRVLWSKYRKSGETCKLSNHARSIDPTGRPGSVLSSAAGWPSCVDLPDLDAVCGGKVQGLPRFHLEGRVPGVQVPDGAGALGGGGMAIREDLLEE